MQSSNGRRWVILRHVVLLPGFILQQFRRIHLRKKKYINRAKLTAQCVYTFYR